MGSVIFKLRNRHIDCATGYPCISNVCQDQILSGHDLNTVYQMKNSSAYWNKLESPWQCFLWHVCQYARPQGAMMPFPHHVKLGHDIALDLSYLHWNCIIHCAATMCCWKHRQVHRFAVQPNTEGGSVDSLDILIAKLQLYHCHSRHLDTETGQHTDKPVYLNFK